MWHAMTDYLAAIALLAIQHLRCPKCQTRMMLAHRRNASTSNLSALFNFDLFGEKKQTPSTVALPLRTPCGIP
jgi:hypothetical protein